jgi:hypothetical protein
MKDVIDLQGVSGATYRFRRLDDPAAPPGTAGNFVYARWQRGALVVLFLSEADSLVAIKARWPEAQALHKAVDVYFRLNVAGEVRHREHHDLLPQLQPVMNVAGPDEA